MKVAEKPELFHPEAKKSAILILHSRPEAGVGEGLEPIEAF
jgi:hypothetical protein